MFLQEGLTGGDTSLVLWGTIFPWYLNHLNFLWLGWTVKTHLTFYQYAGHTEGWKDLRVKTIGLTVNTVNNRKGGCSEYSAKTLVILADATIALVFFEWIRHAARWMSVWWKARMVQFLLSGSASRRCNSAPEIVLLVWGMECGQRRRQVRVWCRSNWCRSRCSWRKCWGSRRRCHLQDKQTTVLLRNCAGCENFQHSVVSCGGVSCVTVAITVASEMGLMQREKHGCWQFVPNLSVKCFSANFSDPCFYPASLHWSQRSSVETTFQAYFACKMQDCRALM